MSYVSNQLIIYQAIKVVIIKNIDKKYRLTV